MADLNKPTIDAQFVVLAGVRYAILPEAEFHWLCENAGVQPNSTGAEVDPLMSTPAADRDSLAAKLVQRRRAVALTQAELARRAGIRPETLNRIERGRRDPDFATVRKLVVAMNAAERAHLADEHPNPKPKSSA